MAILKNLDTSTLVLRIRNGINEKEEPVYKTKSFSNTNMNASIENLYNVASAIGAVLDKELSDIIVKETSFINSQI